MRIDLCLPISNMHSVTIVSESIKQIRASILRPWPHLVSCFASHGMQWMRSLSIVAHAVSNRDSKICFRRITSLTCSQWETQSCNSPRCNMPASDLGCVMQAQTHAPFQLRCEDSKRCLMEATAAVSTLQELYF